MSRLHKEIITYQKITDALKEGVAKDISVICAEVSISEKTLFKYLDIKDLELPLDKILWQDKPLSLEIVQEYNKKKEVNINKNNKRSVRLAYLLRLLNESTPSGGISLPELVQRLNVCERTVFRDLLDLESTHGIVLIRPEKKVGKQGKYRIENTYLPPISPDKALFIYLSMLQQKDTALHVGVQEIKQALLGTLTKYKYNIDDIALERLEDRIYIIDEVLAEPEIVGENFLKIIKAIEASNLISINYFKFYNQEISERTLKPYGLICKHHNWYLVAYCLSKLDIRTFRIDQIEKIYIQNETFSFPDDFNLEDYIADCWGVFKDKEIFDVKVKFIPAVAYRLKKIRYHPNQEIIEELLDGSIVVKFKITGLQEFIGWLLQWRTAAKVIEPANLVNLMKKSLINTLDLYE